MEIFASGTPIHYYYELFSYKDPIVRKAETAKAAKEFFVDIETNKRHPSKIALENIRLCPKLRLTEQLSIEMVENFVSDMNNEQTSPSEGCGNSRILFWNTVVC